MFHIVGKAGFLSSRVVQGSALGLFIRGDRRRGLYRSWGG